MKKSKNTLFADIRSHEIRDWERILSVSQKEYTILDIETTGIHSDITELAAMKVKKGKVTERYHTLVKPRGAMERRVVEMTGITPALVKNAPPVEEVLPSFIGFLGKDILMGHGLDSDLIEPGAAQGHGFDDGVIDRRFSQLLVEQEFYLTVKDTALC